MPKDNKNLIVALDVGTSKVACLVAELRPDASLEILGMGGHESKGLKKGVVVNIEATVGAIQRALEEAELMADCKISSAFVGIAGNHIRSFNSTGMVAIKDREVSALDVERAIDTARAQHPDRPADPPRAAAGIHYRRPGGCARAHRHVGGPPGSEGAYRHGRSVGGAEHRQMRAALRARSE